MAKSLRVCEYPKNGFGEKNGRWYLLDQFGNKYDFVQDKDSHDWSVSVFGVTMSAENIPQLVQDLTDTFGWDIKKW